MCARTACRTGGSACALLARAASLVRVGLTRFKRLPPRLTAPQVRVRRLRATTGCGRPLPTASRTAGARAGAAGARTNLQLSPSTLDARLHPRALTPPRAPAQQPPQVFPTPAMKQGPTARGPCALLHLLCTRLHTRPLTRPRTPAASEVFVTQDGFRYKRRKREAEPQARAPASRALPPTVQGHSRFRMPFAPPLRPRLRHQQSRLCPRRSHTRSLACTRCMRRCRQACRRLSGFDCCWMQSPK